MDAIRQAAIVGAPHTSVNQSNETIIPTELDDWRMKLNQIIRFSELKWLVYCLTPRILICQGCPVAVLYHPAQDKWYIIIAGDDTPEGGIY